MFVVTCGSGGSPHKLLCEADIIISVHVSQVGELRYPHGHYAIDLPSCHYAVVDIVRVWCYMRYPWQPGWLPVILALRNGMCWRHI